MKVQSLRVLESLEEDSCRRTSQVVSLFGSKRRADKVIILDGPFAETKEYCSHVALLARYSRKDDPSTR
jgi:hypothetical protein